VRVAESLVWVAVILGLASCDSSLDVRIEEQPNVLLVVIDTLRADAVQKKRDGIAVMPRLAKLATESIYCPNAVSPCSWTRPAVASVMTSLDVGVHGVYFSVKRGGDTWTTDVLPQSLDTVATFLQQRGYHTMGFQTNSNLSDETGFARGFSSYRFALDAPANEITDAAIQELSSAKSPFFAYVHYIDPHAPYAAPGKFRDAFGKRPNLSDVDKRAANDSLNYLKDFVYGAFGLQAKRNFASISTEGKNELKSLYDAECRFLDSELARLLDDVERKHPNTLIVIVSDHGEEFWEHGSMGHGTTLHVEQVEVPLVIHGPGLPIAKRLDRVSTLDIVPTIFGYLGLEPNPLWQGRNLLAEGRELEKEYVYSMTRSPDSKFGIDFEMVQSGKWKLIRDAKSGTTNLFDTIQDRGENVDLVETNPEIAKELAAALDSRNTANREHPLRTNADVVPLSEEALQQLKALGYVGYSPGANSSGAQ
jgi:arylsulfatase A-like enzyme